MSSEPAPHCTHRSLRANAHARYRLGSCRVSCSSDGPISVAIDASHESLSFYSSGVYYEPQCKNGPNDLDHAVLVRACVLLCAVCWSFALPRGPFRWRVCPD